MVKLSTPVQYEPSIGKLNALRPLQLVDECKTVISYPALCFNPVDKGKPAVGRLACCDKSGSLIKIKNVWYDNYQEVESSWYEAYTQHPIVFAQKVFMVYAFTTYNNFSASLWWTDPTYTKFYDHVDYNRTVVFRFVGQVMYFSSNAGVGESHAVKFCGFY